MSKERTKKLSTLTKMMIGMSVAVVIIGSILLVSFYVLSISLDRVDYLYNRYPGMKIKADCTMYYHDVISGTTHNRDVENAVKLFPELGTDESVRKEFANSQTVGDALKYFNDYDKLAGQLNEYCVVVDYFYYIVPISEERSDVNNTNIVFCEYTTLGELFDLEITENSDE